jgi:SAM-dependent methyltransferase
LQPGPGLELGGSAHNSWGIPNTINVDCTDDMDTVYKREEIHLCGRALAVDVMAQGDRLPFADSSFNWIINSHVFEHLPDPMSALIEWHRVVAHGGIIFSNIPKRDAHPGDRSREVSLITEICIAFWMGYTLDTHPIENGCECRGGHYYCWDVDLYLTMVGMLVELGIGLDIVAVLETDDKVGNSHAFALKVVK